MKNILNKFSNNPIINKDIWFTNKRYNSGVQETLTSKSYLRSNLNGNEFDLIVSNKLHYLRLDNFGNHVNQSKFIDYLVNNKILTIHIINSSHKKFTRWHGFKYHLYVNSHILNDNLNVYLHAFNFFTEDGPEENCITVLLKIPLFDFKNMLT